MGNRGEFLNKWVNVFLDRGGLSRGKNTRENKAIPDDNEVSKTLRIGQEMLPISCSSTVASPHAMLPIRSLEISLPGDTRIRSAGTIICIRLESIRRHHDLNASRI